MTPGCGVCFRQVTFEAGSAAFVTGRSFQGVWAALCAEQGAELAVNASRIIDTGVAAAVNGVDTVISSACNNSSAAGGVSAISVLRGVSLRLLRCRFRGAGASVEVLLGKRVSISLAFNSCVIKIERTRAAARARRHTRGGTRAAAHARRRTPGGTRLAAEHHGCVFEGV
eukprot:jgi/Ulvmu1/2110/UM126_0002.1